MFESKIENQIRSIDYKWTLESIKKREIKWIKFNTWINDVESFQLTIFIDKMLHLSSNRSVCDSTLKLFENAQQKNQNESFQLSIK
jgi:hypothetical protein